MKAAAKPVLAALLGVMVCASTSCGDFFPSASEIVSMTISPTSGLVKPGATTQFTASGVLGNNQTSDVTGQVSWTSSNSAIATIDQSGLATGVALGSVTIQAKANDVTSTATLLVSNITSITVTPASATISPGGSQQLKATDQDGNDITASVTWTSSDTTQATVSTGGLVTVSTAATPSGTVTITATAGTLTGSSTITVGL